MTYLIIKWQQDCIMSHVITFAYRHGSVATCHRTPCSWPTPIIIQKHPGILWLLSSIYFCFIFICTTSLSNPPLSIMTLGLNSVPVVTRHKRKNIPSLYVPKYAACFGIFSDVYFLWQGSLFWLFLLSSSHNSFYHRLLHQHRKIL